MQWALYLCNVLARMMTDTEKPNLMIVFPELLKGLSLAGKRWEPSRRRKDLYAVSNHTGT